MLISALVLTLARPKTGSSQYKPPSETLTTSTFSHIVAARSPTVLTSSAGPLPKSGSASLSEQLGTSQNRNKKAKLLFFAAGRPTGFPRKVITVVRRGPFFWTFYYKARSLCQRKKKEENEFIISFYSAGLPTVDGFFFATFCLCDFVVFKASEGSSFGGGVQVRLSCHALWLSGTVILRKVGTFWCFLCSGKIGQNPRCLVR